jgi:3-deoxy-manno-octulosonate cytidylyltransferase (CMP-KDO synthetase)
MKVSIIIPSRLASTRLPEKPLSDIAGKSLIERVYQQALKSRYAHEVIVATDHQKIYDHVLEFGGTVVMTSPHHASGTDRIAEIAVALDSDIIVNLQGDEPCIDPRQIDALISEMINQPIAIGTQCMRIQSADELFDYNVVKVVRDLTKRAMFFSRQAIPACRDLPYRHWFEFETYYRHVGMYAYRRQVLLEITGFPMSAYEKAESLEQLRWLQNGIPVYCFETTYSSIGVDTQDDLERVRALFTS